jgi:hypothetical protein
VVLPKVTKLMLNCEAAMVQENAAQVRGAKSADRTGWLHCSQSQLSRRPRSAQAAFFSLPCFKGWRSDAPGSERAGTCGDCSQP